MEGRNHLQQRFLACAAPVLVLAQGLHRSLMFLGFLGVLSLVLGLSVVDGFADLLVSLTVAEQLFTVQLLVDGLKLFSTADRP